MCFCLKEKAEPEIYDWLIIEVKRSGSVNNKLGLLYVAKRFANPNVNTLGSNE